MSDNKTNPFACVTCRHYDPDPVLVRGYGWCRMERLPYIHRADSRCNQIFSDATKGMHMPHIMQQDDREEMLAILVEVQQVAHAAARARVSDAEADGYVLGHEPAKTRQAAFKVHSEAMGESWRADMIERIRRVKNADR